MEEEFNLSVKKKTPFDCIPNKKSFYFYPEEDVKKFIKLEGYLLQSYILEEITWEEMCDKRRKLIGDLK